MNENIKEFKHKTVTPGFIKALCSDELIYEFIGQYIDYKKTLYAVIDDDTSKNEFHAVEKLSEIIYKEGSEIFEISDSDTCTSLVYKSDENTVLFIIKKNYSIAIWND